jgi:hypothetical protein
MPHDAAPYRSEAFAEDLIEPLPADDRRLEWLAWSVVAASLLGILWA